MSREQFGNHYFNNIRRTSRSLYLIRNNGYSKVHWSPKNFTASDWKRTVSTFLKTLLTWGQSHSVPILQLHSELLTLYLFKSYWLAKENTIQPLQAYSWINDQSDGSIDNDQSGVSIDHWSFSIHCLRVVIKKEAHFITQTRKAHFWQDAWIVYCRLIYNKNSNNYTFIHFVLNLHIYIK